MLYLQLNIKDRYLILLLYMLYTLQNLMRSNILCTGRHTVVQVKTDHAKLRNTSHYRNINNNATCGQPMQRCQNCRGAVDPGALEE